ncbi:hypothetical protein ACHAXT_012008 [Thalassiosira profunda]
MAPLSLLLSLAAPPLLLSHGAGAFAPSLARPAGSSLSADAAGRRRLLCSHDEVARSRRRGAALGMSAAEAALPLPAEDDDDDDMEWVEEEFELLTERDFYNTEWKIGTLMDNKPREASSIDTTWVRLVTTDSGENAAIWGDDSKGKWTLDVPSQFFSISKETFGGWFGKQIWAGTVEDFYYLEGTVRGWSPISPASVDGQWQAVRLGEVDGERVSVEERGEAPWFMVKEEVAEEEEGEDGEGEGEVEGEAGDAEDEVQS